MEYNSSVISLELFSEWDRLKAPWGEGHYGRWEGLGAVSKHQYFDEFIAHLKKKKKEEREREETTK